MTEEKRSEILAANKSMADQALRVLCGAQRSWMEMPRSTAPETLEQQLCYLGLSGMIDPIRPEVKAAVAECFVWHVSVPGLARTCPRSISFL